MKLQTNHLIRLIVFLAFLTEGFNLPIAIGQNVESFGVYGGLNFPFTLDEGLKKDPRFYGQFTLRASPIGICYGYDKVGYGFVITPGYYQVGQKFIIKNTIGGEVGTRDIKMNYLSVPMAFKIHLTDLAFFRLSMIAAVNLNYLVSGSETISHSLSKLRYPATVLIPSEAGYSEAYDGVFVPDVQDLEYVKKDKFKPFQLFGAIGLRSDFDISEDWSINFDGRANVGIFDPRKEEYINQLKQPENTPDLYGQRREIYLSVAVGINRIIQIKDSFQGKKSSKPKVSNRKGKNKRPMG